MAAFRLILCLSLLCALCKISICTDGDLMENLPANSSNYIPWIKQVFNDLDFISMVNRVDDEMTNITTSTKNCLKRFSSLSKKEKFELFDATGKISAGILYDFSRNWIGNYRECMMIKKSHYCMQTGLKLFQTFPFALGLCVPKQCNGEDINNIMKWVVERENLTLISTTSHAKVVCYPERKYTTGCVVMLLITSLLVLICFVGTVVDVINNFMTKQHENVLCGEDKYSILPTKDDIKNMKEHEKKMSTVQKLEDMAMIRFILCFSIIKNTKSIFDTRTRRGSIKALNGIRFLSMTWVIGFHLFSIALGILRTALDIYGWVSWLGFAITMTTPFGVDTFLLASGLSNCVSNLKRYETQGKFGLCKYYIHRLIRILPSYMYALFFYTYVYPLLGDGPFWISQAPGSTNSENCVKYWWTNLLHINNMYPHQYKNQCFQHSWYLAVDMQYYVLMPIVFYIMRKYKWIGAWTINGILLFAYFIINAILIYTNNASKLISFNNQKIPINEKDSAINRYSQYIYSTPWTRMGPYVVGVMLGYLLLKNVQYNGRRKRLWHCSGWLVAIILAAISIYGARLSTAYEWKMPSLVSYGIMGRFVWAIAVAWIIYACHNDYGGHINDFLSWKAFVPLSRLSYCAYLIHVMALLLIYYSQETVVHLNAINSIYYLVSGVSVSFIGGYLLAVLVEYPFKNMEKLFFKSCKPYQQKTLH